MPDPLFFVAQKCRFAGVPTVDPNTGLVTITGTGVFQHVPLDSRHPGGQHG